MGTVLEVRNLVLRFHTYQGVVKALEGIDLEVSKGETMGLVGESGCGKTVLALSILGLIPPSGKIESGKILFWQDGKNVDLLEQDQEFLREIRGKGISMIFQEPSDALNPLYTVKDQIGEVLLQHRLDDFLKRTLDIIEREMKGGIIVYLVDKIYRRMRENPNSLISKLFSKIPILRRYRRRLEKEVRQEVVNILRQMEIGDPERVVDLYPHELSGGMRQRVMIGMALACNPLLLLADEPTTSLDVTVQAQVLSLLEKLKGQFGASILYITHDMGVVAEICDRVTIMYAGSICEVAEVGDIFEDPLHPYTKGLLESIPKAGEELRSIPGTIASLIDAPTGCRFHPRCPYVMEVCSKTKPELKEVGKGHLVACYLY